MLLKVFICQGRVNDFCDPCFWHMTDADIISAMAKQSDNKEEEGGIITIIYYSCEENLNCQ